MLPAHTLTVNTFYSVCLGYHWNQTAWNLVVYLKVYWLNLKVTIRLMVLWRMIFLADLGILLSISIFFSGELQYTDYKLILQTHISHIDNDTYCFRLLKVSPRFRQKIAIKYTAFVSAPDITLNGWNSVLFSPSIYRARTVNEAVLIWARR